ncbi:MAG: tRNA (N(6)-L-threonylcarbamoyladenosine(37)-C(2))-methylthiotransferase MtaB [Deltaproteobacteria bacterium RBG_19FT_COMBO_60_16]|nr:MAG: tRNA (N(6)-L-threonylcarbamoyladenosine(37)-C(2))-methylthiotransferase MtaB [Deltaproteobacteria bacterium RBG_16_64_85]OGP99924.1 MAG: tRNA (N(6)-L-threonylcarbamoyladenosine(37)-C(2))-methylthiotransferase MtaB [Deltaproteobacteria bacterium RBG_19FT_COMBO_60_16]
MRKRLTVLTVGCKANFADSASIVREAMSAGFEVVSPAEPADVIVVNSCTVTHRADRDSRALARRARRDHPHASVILTGCYAQASPRAREALHEVDHWVGLGEEGALGSVFRQIGDGDPARPHPLSEYAADLLLGHRRTFLKIQDGCDFSCAYCVVPMVRGGNRSLPEKEILEKAVEAERDGARELVLTGIHVGLYGADRGEKEALAQLIAVLLNETERTRLRLSSIEPAEITEGLLDAISGSRRVCPHLHIPLQSGCDRTLSRMRRPYRAGQYADVVGRVVARVPDAQVGADVIAGFPGETKADFEETVRFLCDVPVNYFHVFPYSAREGTESARWPDDVHAREKKERVAILLHLDAKKRTAFLRDQVGKELEVLAETVHPGRGELSGTSGNYVEVTFPGEITEVGGLFRVRACSIRGRGLAGKRDERNV